MSIDVTKRLNFLQRRPYGSRDKPHNAELLCVLAIQAHSGAHINTAEFAKKHGICQRTVQRWMTVIECIMPLEYVDHGGAGAYWRKMSVVRTGTERER